jgi:polysaccharide biosynthesis PFTS motif protein
LQSWSHYVAFNDSQATRLSDWVIGAPSIVVRGPIDFSDDLDIEIDLPRRTILVLDTPVRRLLLMPSSGAIDRYITQQYSAAFFAGIAKAAAALGATVAWKGKRYGGGRRALAYERAVDLVSQHAPLIVLNENLSPRRLALHCAACVAAPFTSAAMLFQASGRPAAYYDALAELPEGLTEKNGLPVFADQARLQQWLSAALIRADAPDRAGLVAGLN